MGIEKDRMLAGELYVSLYADREGRMSVLRALMGSVGEGSEIRPPFHCNFGIHISVGSRTLINFGARDG